MTTRPTTPVANPRTKRRLFSSLAFITSGAILAFVAFELVYCVKPMKAVFVDFHLQLPAATQILLQLSDLFSAGGWIAFVATPLLLGFLVPRFTSTQKARSPEDYARIITRLTAMMMVGLVAMGIIVVVHVALELPMTTLIEGISAHR